MSTTTGDFVYDEGVDPTPYLDISGAVSPGGQFTNTGTVFYASGNETMYNVISPDNRNYKWHIFDFRNMDQTTWTYVYNSIYGKLRYDANMYAGWRLKLPTNSTDIVYHFVYYGDTIMYKNIFYNFPEPTTV
jgi:hypothetical protein